MKELSRSSSRLLSTKCNSSRLNTPHTSFPSYNGHNTLKIFVSLEISRWLCSSSPRPSHGSEEGQRVHLRPRWGRGLPTWLPSLAGQVCRQELMSHQYVCPALSISTPDIKTYRIEGIRSELKISLQAVCAQSRGDTPLLREAEGGGKFWGRESGLPRNTDTLRHSDTPHTHCQGE